jgi:hypothetical protein
MINGEMLASTSNFLVQSAEPVIFGLYVRAQKPIHGSSGYALRQNMKLFNQPDSSKRLQNGKSVITFVLELKVRYHKEFGLSVCDEHVTLVCQKLGYNTS